MVLSFESTPDIEFSNNAESSTVLVIGPICSMLFAYEIRPYLLTRPYVGFSPTTEQKLAGFLIEPPVSDPNDAMHSLAETDTALPPDEPPGTKSVFHGFLLGPYALNSVLNPIANSSRLVFPIIIASSNSNLETAVPVYGAIKFSRTFDAHVVIVPSTHMLSFTEIGIP